MVGEARDELRVEIDEADEQLHFFLGIGQLMHMVKGLC
jgi:hypothetical protein